MLQILANSMLVDNVFAALKHLASREKHKAPPPPKRPVLAALLP